MIYVRYHPENEHKETCTFQVWSRELGCMTFCGALATGYSGHALDTRVMLCTEHFEQCRRNEGIHESDIKKEKKIG